MNQPTHPESQQREVVVQLENDHVATVEIRRPPDNYFDVHLIEELAEAFEELASNSSCRCVVLCSDGRHFCAGANFTRQTDRTDRTGPHLYEVGLRLFEQPLPVVAAIQGAAIGGGLGLALVADFRVGCPEARFAANFAKLGFHQGFALSVTLPAVIGQQAALDLLYTGRRIGGEEAHAMGLLDRLTDQNRVRDDASALASQIAASAPLAVRSIRETMRGSLAAQARSIMKRERSEQERLMQTKDWREGVRAMNQRREPNFIAE